MKKLTIAIVAFGLAAFSAGAQDSDRAAQMRRVVEGLNSADPVTRIITFEDAMATKDKNIQRIALQTAFASSDLALRSAAMEGVMANKSALLIKIKTYAEENRRHVLKATEGQLNLRIAEFDAASGNFLTYSNVSYRERVPNSSRNARRPIVHAGNFSGDRISFEVNIGGGGGGSNSETCVGAASLGESGSVLTGTMSCSGGGRGRYGIEIDLLR